MQHERLAFLRAGTLAALMVNIWTERGTEPAEPADFFPVLDPDHEEVDEGTWAMWEKERLRERFAALNRSRGYDEHGNPTA